jgi:hypothetical protein
VTGVIFAWEYWSGSSNEGTNAVNVAWPVHLKARYDQRIWPRKLAPVEPLINA